MDQLSIGELAKQAHVNIETIRYYPYNVTYIDLRLTF
jgi:hypothetical protein